VPLYHLFTTCDPRLCQHSMGNIHKQWEHKIPSSMNFIQLHSIYPCSLLKETNCLNSRALLRDLLLNSSHSIPQTSCNLTHFSTSLYLYLSPSMNSFSNNTKASIVYLYTQRQQDSINTSNERPSLLYVCCTYGLHHSLCSSTQTQHHKKCHKNT